MFSGAIPCFICILGRTLFCTPISCKVFLAGPPLLEVPKKKYFGPPLREPKILAAPSSDVDEIEYTYKGIVLNINDLNRIG